MFFVRAPGFRFSGIAPGFYPGVAGPVRSVPGPRFLSIVLEFYLGFAAGYYF